MARKIAPAPAVIARAEALRGELRLPGDKSISHRALLLALLARGESRISGAGDGADVRSTAAVADALGARVERLRSDGRTVDYRVASPGVGHLHAPAGVLDCGNSGTSMRLIAGILAGLPFRAVLDGDRSLRRRPMARIIEPLTEMGATIAAKDGVPPLTITGRDPLRPIDWATPVPSAQVKSAILLAGLRAAGTTRVHETAATRDHTERMLRARGVTVRTIDSGDGGVTIEIEGGRDVAAIDERIPGDPSAAAFWLVAGAIHPDAELRIGGVGVNPTRRAIIDLLRTMGADIEERPAGDADGDATGADTTHGIGEPIADLVVRSSELRAIDLRPAEVAAAIDEIPVLCLAATQARGTTTIRGAGELRVKESDRIAGIAAGLTALGADVSVDRDDLTIHGPTRLSGSATDSLDDHRLAMTFAVAGLIASDTTTVGRPASAGISYPGFFADLERIRA